MEKFKRPAKVEVYDNERLHIHHSESTVYSNVAHLLFAFLYVCENTYVCVCAHFFSDPFEGRFADIQIFHPQTL